MIAPVPEEMKTIILKYGNKEVVIGGGGGIHEGSVAHFFFAPLLEPYDEKRGAMYDTSSLAATLDFTTLESIDHLIARLKDLRDKAKAFLDSQNEL